MIDALRVAPGSPHVVPADRNWGKSTSVATVLVETLERLDPRVPDADPGLQGLLIA